jgi:hypothetical protein
MAPYADTKSSTRDVAEEGGISYGSISPLAVSSLLLALISPLALYGPQVWIVPVLGILAAIRAQRSIRDSEGTLTGMWMARLALPLGLLFLSAGVTRSVADHLYLLHSAEQVTTVYFRDLRHNDPHRAMQWESPVSGRRPLDGLLWEYYRDDKGKARQLRSFTEQPLIKTLLLLGQRADIRLYKTLELATTDSQNSLSQIFAVTFDEDGKKKTFFVQVDLVRETDFGGPRHWRIKGMAGPIRPMEYQN